MSEQNTALSAANIQRFARVFRGLDRAYGIYTVPADAVPDEHGKLKGKAQTLHGHVTGEMYARHLRGEGRGLGIIPVTDNGVVYFGCIDVDEYGGLDHAKIALAMMDADYRFLVTRSKSGGAHCWLPVGQPVPAAAMRAALASVVRQMGLPASTECFPKQVTPGEVGNWVNLAYFDAAQTTRYAVTADGEKLSLEQFLAIAEQAAEFNKPELFTSMQAARSGSSNKNPFVVLNTPNEGPLADAPPCLQHLALTGITTLRNETLADVRSYLKQKNPSGWEKDLEEFNRAYCPEPIDSGEMQGLLKGGRNKDYRYRCGSDHLKPHCNWSLCVTRPYGLPNPVQGLGTLTKYDSDPPTYDWEVDGVAVRGLTFDDIALYPRFRRAVGQRINKLLPKVKDDNWETIVNEHMGRMRIEKMEGVSEVDMFWGLLEQFCTYNPDEDIQGVLRDRPVCLDGRVYFKLRALMKHLDAHKFKGCSMQRAAAIMRQRGGLDLSKEIMGKTERIWSVPEFQEMRGQFDIPASILLDVKAF